MKENSGAFWPGLPHARFGAGSGVVMSSRAARPPAPVRFRVYRVFLWKCGVNVLFGVYSSLLYKSGVPLASMSALPYKWCMECFLWLIHFRGGRAAAGGHTRTKPIPQRACGALAPPCCCCPITSAIIIHKCHYLQAIWRAPSRPHASPPAERPPASSSRPREPASTDRLRAG